MPYRQIVEPNLDPYIYQDGQILNSWLGWCLAYVNTAYGAGWAGSSAREGWDNSAGKHQDMNIPSGVYVPIWFHHYGTYGGVYKNWGHVAIWKDGQIWTSPYTNKPYADVFNDINALCRMYNCTYIGWTEFVGPTRVIEPVADTPPAQLAPHQRTIGSEGANYRVEPSKDSTAIKEFNPGDVLDFKGYVHGQDPYGNGNNIWFVGAYTGGYIYSGSCTDSSTNGLNNITTVTPPPVVTPPVQPDTSKYVIDVSSHNAITDYATVISNVRGAIAKAGHTGKSYGGTPINGDPKFNDYKNNFGTKLNGAYWYAYCSLDATTEAANFVQAVGVVPDNFTYWLDIEENDDQSNDKINAWCKSFLNEIDKRTGKVCGLYMNRNWFDNIITSDTKGSRPIWLAHYDTPELSNLVANQVAHQFTSSGKVVGYAGNLDMNAVKEEFFIPTKITTTPPVVDPPVVTPPVITPPDPEKPVTPPENSGGSLFDVVKQMIDKVIIWLKSWRKGK